ncbi:MarR family transcriptional regulator [Lentzea tibetensis]|uniref:MarR family transcriptional regulator n=2 Tax=Lentzea tibetensis TaxID=2591470 RepID=A0A563ERS2_9PSEU|nr:MarR family transcriptional regulator [Lentzea tibetensis]
MEVTAMKPFSSNAAAVDMYQQPGHLIRRAQQVHNQLWAAEVSSDVTSTQFAVLSAIAVNPATDQNSLAREASLDTSTVADVVNRLAARGFLARAKHPEDRRRNVLTLTDEGARVFEEISESALRMTDKLVGCLTEGDRRDLVRILQRVVEAGESGEGGRT